MLSLIKAISYFLIPKEPAIFDRGGICHLIFETDISSFDLQKNIQSKLITETISNAMDIEQAEKTEEKINNGIKVTFDSLISGLVIYTTIVTNGKSLTLNLRASISTQLRKNNIESLYTVSKKALCDIVEKLGLDLEDGSTILLLALGSMYEDVSKYIIDLKKWTEFERNCEKIKLGTWSVFPSFGMIETLRKKASAYNRVIKSCYKIIDTIAKEEFGLKDVKNVHNSWDCRVDKEREKHIYWMKYTKRRTVLFALTVNNPGEFVDNILCKTH